MSRLVSPRRARKVSTSFLATSDSSLHPLGALQHGNDKFARSRMQRKRRCQVMSRQKPKVVVVCCSDSRVPPEIVFQKTGLGELFVVRCAGHVLDQSSMETIHFALAELGCRSVVVMGHQNCGAVGAIYDKTIGSVPPPSSRTRLPTSSSRFQLPTSSSRSRVESSLHPSRTGDFESSRVDSHCSASSYRGVESDASAEGNDAKGDDDQEGEGDDDPGTDRERKFTLTPCCYPTITYFIQQSLSLDPTKTREENIDQSIRANAIRTAKLIVDTLNIPSSSVFPAHYNIVTGRVTFLDTSDASDASHASTVSGDAKLIHPTSHVTRRSDLPTFV